MSLVPIIYTSLALFFGLMLIVVLISYLSFRARKNTNPVIAEEIRKQRAVCYPPKIIVNRSQNKQYIPVPRFENSRRNITVNQSEPIVLPYNYFQKEQDVSNNNPRITEREIKINNERRKNGNTFYNGSTRTRIEIMNDNKKFQKPEEKQITRKESLARYINDLSQFNLLSFYSDNNADRDFVTATAVPNHPSN
ncbi:MAG: hypothetical protein KGZ42_11180 [Melioribacter sp.]|nr:hypothetical protein [Melioribacter sp.]